MIEINFEIALDISNVSKYNLVTNFDLFEMMGEVKTMCVGQKIKLYLKETGRTQVWLSDQTGIPTPKLNLALSGKRRMTFEEYAAICGALNEDTNRFIEPVKKQT